MRARLRGSSAAARGGRRDGGLACAHATHSLNPGRAFAVEAPHNNTQIARALALALALALAQSKDPRGQAFARSQNCNQNCVLAHQPLCPRWARSLATLCCCQPTHALCAAQLHFLQLGKTLRLGALRITFSLDPAILAAIHADHIHFTTASSRSRSVKRCSSSMHDDQHSAACSSSRKHAPHPPSNLRIASTALIFHQLARSGSVKSQC
ncbi:hypothetical protein L1887_55209 [Cichorium endivia]|nr:hypothetical protein L1887_55209 [Cichorium endivia]